MRRRVSTTCLVAALALPVLVACTAKKPDPQPTGQLTAWQRVEAMIGPNGSVSLDMARAAYAVTFGSLPGVTLPAGERGNVPSATPAIEWILDHFDELTPEQQRAVLSGLDLPEWPIVAEQETPTSPGTATGSPTAATASGPHAAPRRVGIPAARPCGPLEGIPTTAAPADVTGAFVRALADIRAKLSNQPLVALRPVVCLASRDLLVTLQPADPSQPAVQGFTGAATEPIYPGSATLECRFTLFPLGRATLRGNAIHEAMHCINAAFAGRDGVGKRRPIPPWIDEGLASWAAAQLGGEPDAFFWDEYLKHPTKQLTERTYDAIGFFTHVQNVRNDLWQVFPDMLRQSNLFSDQPFNAVVARQRAEVLNSLPSSWFRQPDRAGPRPYGVGPWQISDHGITNTVTTNIVTRTVGNNSTVTVGTLLYSSELFRLQLTADVIVVDPDPNAYGRLGPGDRGDYTLADASRRRFCTRADGCACPGSDAISTFTPIDGSAELAITGGTTGIYVKISGESVKDSCKPVAPPDVPRPAAGCSVSVVGHNGPAHPASALHALPTAVAGGCGVSHGDPHLTTFDGRHFDLQAVGEFLLAKSRDDSLEIQARTAPAGRSRTLSLNTAVAASVNGDRVGVYLDPAGLIVRINGVITDPVAGTTTLPNGGTLTALTGRAVATIGLTWTDGTVLWVVPIGLYGLRIQVAAAPARAGRLYGLLGNDDGADGNDLVFRDGHPLRADYTFADLYPAYANSWRIDQAGSLFDYGPGETTGTFSDATFPDQSSNVDPATRADAEKACRDSGVTDAALLADCVLDVAATGRVEFAYSAKGVQDYLGRPAPQASTEASTCVIKLPATACPTR